MIVFLGKNIGKISVVLSLLYLTNINQVFSQRSNVEEQDQIIRNQQFIDREDERKREEEQIKKERELMKIKSIQKKEIKTTQSETCYPVKIIELVGADTLSKRHKNKTIAPFIKKCFDGNIISNLVDNVNKTYQSLGYVTTQVVVPKQNISSGTLKLEVIEGKISKIKINNDSLLDKMQKFTAFGPVSKGKLTINDVNQGLFQINRLPSNNAVLKVEPSGEVGYSNIEVKNEKSFPIRGNIGYDNLGSEFTGIRRTLFSGTADNLFSLNDQLNLSYTTNLDDPSSVRDYHSFNVGISIPYTYHTFTLNHSRTNYNGTREGNFSISKLKGYSNRTEFDVDRVFVNNLKHRFSGNASLVTKETATYLNGTKLPTTERKLAITNFSATYVRFFKNDLKIYVKPTFVQGVKLFDATRNLNSNPDAPKAQYRAYKLFASVDKTLTIPKIPTSLTFSSEFDGQLSEDTLYGSEQFAVGGYQTVRGFRENNVAGDHGYNFRNKIAFNLGKMLTPALSLKGDSSKSLQYLNKVTMESFYDYGYAETKFGDESGRMSGAGIKAIYGSKNFDLSMTYAWPLQKSKLIDPTYKENKMFYFEIRAKCC